MTTEEAKQTASTILNQLGGNQFIAMTGAKNFTCDENGAFICKIGRNSSKANYLKVKLNGLDLYDVEFIRATVKKYEVIETAENIYNDQLRGLFERVTGLRTSLTAIYA